MNSYMSWGHIDTNISLVLYVYDMYIGSNPGNST